MKGIVTTIDKDKVKASTEQVAVKKEDKFLGSIVLKKGHTMWEINIKERTIVPATYTKSEAVMSSKIKGDIHIRKRLDIKADCIYFSALNKKNAIRHLLRVTANPQNLKAAK